MRRPSLDDLGSFLAIAEHRSFRRAARELEVTPSALSHAMRGLERRLGTRLLNRTTRSVGLTEAGEQLVRRLRPALGEIDDALGQVREADGALTGRIRITTPDYGALLLVGADMVGFADLHPGVEVELVVDTALVDLAAEGFDAGVRFRDQLPPDMVAVPVAPPSAFAVVAAPAYLARHPAPETPAELTGHRCIRQRLASGAVFRWEFVGQGRAVRVEPRGPLTSNSIGVIVAAALAGAGVGYVPAHHVREHVAAGRLVELLADQVPSIDGHCLYYPPTRHPTRAFAAFVRHVRGACG